MATEETLVVFQRLRGTPPCSALIGTQLIPHNFIDTSDIGMSSQQNAKEFFAVDDCFGTTIGRPLAELVEGNRVDRDSPEELVSFEEFIRGGHRQRKKENVKAFDLRPIDDSEDGLNDDDGFFDIALTMNGGGGAVPEDPKATDGMPKGGRSELYKVQQHSSVDCFSDDRCNHLANRRHTEWGEMFTNAPTTTLRHSLCPTVGEGGGWLSGGRTRRESQDSAAYGYEPPDEPCPVGKMSVNHHHNVLSPGLSSRHSLKAADKQTDNGTNATQGTHNPNQMVQSNSLGDLMLSKFLCCFRVLNPTQLGGTGKKVGGETAEKIKGSDKEKQQQQNLKCYSWDERDALPQQNLSDLRFANESNKTLVKEPGQLNGQPFQIENCKDSLILLMDRTASLTVDDSRDCVLLVGPCQGSIFLRDCSNILILAVCQQFRTRDCRQLVAHLFCATSPTIEETDLTIFPLLLNYSGLLAQMHAAGLSPFVNRWRKVHNFTPETGKCQLGLNSGVFPTAAPHNFLLIERLNNFVAHSSLTKRLELCIGNANISQLFVEDKCEENGEKDSVVLVLLQPLSGSNSDLRFYSESVQLARGLLALEDAKLVAMHDIDLMTGEWDALLGQNKRKHSAANGKIITLEVRGAAILRRANTFLHSLSKMSSVSAQLVEGERMEQYKKQLYRFCEIRQSI